MGDIRKTFNFRDGVQVDDEVLVVRGNRVGLGTTSPDQLLDVRGNANITGVTSTVNFNVTGVGTFNQIKVGAGIILDATSGVMTATTFKGMVHHFIKYTYITMGRCQPEWWHHINLQ